MNRHSRHSPFSAAIMACALGAMFIAPEGYASNIDTAGTDAPRQPVEYEVQEQSMIDNKMYYKGDRCFYAGLPAENLKPIDAEGEARFKEYKESNAKRIADLKGQTDGSGLGISDPKAFAAAFAQEQQKANAERDEKTADAISRGISEGIAQGMQALLAAQVPAQTATAPAPANEAKPADEHKPKSKQS